MTNGGCGMRYNMVFTYILQPATWLMLTCAVCLQCHQASEPIVEVADTTSGTADLAGFAVGHATAGYGELARTDPIGFLRLCRARYRFRDYTCTFVKQELIRNRLTKAQEISVRFREEPFSVDMEWIKNADQAERALYVENAWKDSKGRELAWFKPAGALNELLARLTAPNGNPRPPRVCVLPEGPMTIPCLV